MAGGGRGRRLRHGGRGRAPGPEGVRGARGSGVRCARGARARGV